MKKILYTIVLCSLGSFVSSAPNETPLTDPILKIIDGKAGIFDSTKVKSTLWLMREIRSIHGRKTADGIVYSTIKINSKGLPDPKSGTSQQLMFRGEKQTIKSLIALETQASSFSTPEKREFDELFHELKDYFDKVNKILMADARGAHQFMIKLIREYCRKNNRMSSLLLKWDDKGGENEMYEHDIVNFRVFYEFSTDLLNFLGALIKSCPKAYAEARAGYKKS